MQRTVERMGDQLDAVVGLMVPRCDICGAGFGAGQTVVVTGASRKHKECQVAGAPQFMRQMSAKQAFAQVQSLAM